MQCGAEREWWAIDGETEADVSSFSQKEEASCFAFRKSASSRNSISSNIPLAITFGHTYYRD